MAVALNEKVIIKASRHHVKIVKDGPARGMTVVDWWNVTKRKKNVYYINSIKDDEFFAFLTDRIRLL